MEQSTDEREIEVSSCDVEEVERPPPPGELGSGRTAEQFR